MYVLWTRLAFFACLLAGTKSARSTNRVVGGPCHTSTGPGLWCHVTRYCLGAEQANRCVPGRTINNDEKLACCHTKSRPRGDIANDWSFMRRARPTTTKRPSTTPWYLTEDPWLPTEEIPTTTMRTTKRPPTTKPKMESMLKLVSDEEALEIATKKCLAYDGYSYVEKVSDTLLPDPEVIREQQCLLAGQPLISGGVPANPGEFPHMVALGYELPENEVNTGDSEETEEDAIAWRCGGSLISEQFVMTAAHCAYDKRTGPVRWAQLGSGELNDPLAQRIRIDKVIKYPTYSARSHYDDIALLLLQEKPTLSPELRPACIGIHQAVPVRPGDFGTAYDVTGWGLNTTGGSGLKHLMKVDLHLVAVEKCEELFEFLKGKRMLKDGIRRDSMLCIGNSEEIKNTCQGDSGGPVQTRLNNKIFGCMHDVAGITSFGESDCGGMVLTAGIYTNVRHYLPWIVSVVWPEETNFV